MRIKKNLKIDLIFVYIRFRSSFEKIFDIKKENN